MFAACCFCAPCMQYLSLAISSPSKPRQNLHSYSLTYFLLVLTSNQVKIFFFPLFHSSSCVTWSFTFDHTLHARAPPVARPTSCSTLWAPSCPGEWEDQLPADGGWQEAARQGGRPGNILSSGRKWDYVRIRRVFLYCCSCCDFNGSVVVVSSDVIVLFDVVIISSSCSCRSSISIVIFIFTVIRIMIIVVSLLSLTMTLLL